MTAEHDAQADLALFKDQPTTAASAAPQSSHAQTRSHVNEEPYQPVGMRPTSTSPAVTSATATPVSVVASTVPSQESGERLVSLWHRHRRLLLQLPLVPLYQKRPQWLHNLG